MDNKYQNAKIYKLYSDETDMVYIGSTTKTLKQRLGEHLRGYSAWLKGNKNYVSSFEILKYADYYIELIEDYPCETKKELERREGKIIKTFENAVNKIIAGRSKKEYCIDNKDKIAERNKRYRDNNKDKIAEYQRQHYEDNKDEILEYQRQYYKQHYYDNKDEILEYKRKKVQCDICDKIMNQSSLSRHKKSKH